MKSKAEILEQLKGMGVKKKYKPFCLTEWDSIELMVSKPVKIVNGDMKGCAVDVYDCQTFRIWTSQTKKANAYAKKYALKATFLDGEAELLVPVSLADEILPAFGAKVKHPISPERLKALQERMKGIRNATTMPFGAKKD